jgi:large-conductance mechanosensitive channel
LCRNLYISARRPAVNNIVKYLIIAFVLFFVVTQPDSAASIITKGIDGLQSIGNGVSNFVTQTAL